MFKYAHLILNCDWRIDDASHNEVKIYDLFEDIRLLIQIRMENKDHFMPQFPIWHDTLAAVISVKLCHDWDIRTQIRAKWF